MSNPASDTVHYLFLAGFVGGLGGLVFAILGAIFGYPQIALISFYISLLAILLLIGLAAAILAGAVRRWRRGAVR